MDEIRLRQILLNLVGNAVKFTDKGYIKILIHHSFQKNKKLIDLSIIVEDTGIGISKKDYQIIFETFKQKIGNINKKYQGTGLGLSITKKLVEMMEGHISVKSRIKKGSTFMIQFKNVKIAHETDQGTSKSHQESSGLVKFNKEKVMIVDDIESNRILMKEILESMNLKVLIAKNGQQAVKLYQTKDPDLILMDLRMPIMDGYQAAAIIKKNRQIPIIALSASTNFIESKIEFKNQFDGFLTKPVDINNLMTELFKFISPMIIKDDILALSRVKDENQIDMNVIDKNKLKEYFQKEILPMINDQKGVIKINMIKLLAEKLLFLSQQHQSHSLKKKSVQLSDYADEFDIIKIKSTLNELYEMINQFTV